MQHIIKKQVIEISLDKKLDAFYIQQKVSNYYYAKILPLLHQAFDAASSDDELITIERLEINIGTLDAKEFENGDWEEKIFRNISEQLIPVSHGLNSPVKTAIKPRQLSDASQWLFYMRYGYLSWNVLEINEAWRKNVLEGFATDTILINKLRELINHYSNALTRIVAQHSQAFLKSLIETLTAQNQDLLPALINELAKLRSGEDQKRKSLTSIQFEKAKQKFSEEALKLSSSTERDLTSSKIISLLLISNFSTNEMQSKKLKEFTSRNEINLSALNQSGKDLNKKLKALDEVTAVKDIKTDFGEEGIYVINAGIILLHPFLQRFFTNLGLIKEKHFTDGLAQQKALQLLHYLATGNANPAEHELVIPKILCGFALENPVDHLIELKEEEKMEANSLLESAIGQWTILKGTSPDGLREGFLQRKGKLFRDNGNVVLQVEQGAIDMLLDQLPWNLSLIKLPWMNDILKVEWR